MRIGSDAHKTLFCEAFLSTHVAYEPRDLPWPELDEEHLSFLRSVPFWQTALGVEQNAGRMVTAFAEGIEDPLVRRAMALQGFEETRHAQLLETFVERYELPVDPPAVPGGPATKHAFTVFGYEECLDSYFGFGIFGLARAAEMMPESLMSLFEVVLKEEARHITFFVNWIAYERVRVGIAGLGPLLTAYGYLRALLRLAATALSARGASKRDGAGTGTGFLAPGAVSIQAGLSARGFLASCDVENKKYMAEFDARLLRPRVLPALGAFALRILPQGRVAAPVVS